KKEVKVTKTITNIETKEDTQPTKAVANENSESKKVTPIDNSLETKTEPTKNQKNSLENLLKTQHNESKKENVSNSVKIEPIREKVDIEAIETKESSDKTVVNHETKVQNVDKTKSTPDLKKTFTTFAEEFKEKVESYKPPLMKIKMELKPHGLGEVDVTLLNRGNNLQVNINSNANTIAMFAQNQVEFKNSLVNMGFSDLQMNFSEQQKKEQGQQKQQENKSSFEQFDETDEQDGFEMIVPQYV
ncbi:MAG: flagellar hook-length control protein FliK, partial [Epsilonproteobacteria bacterium]|nr:flagellar hook-length control protein FliK [Campylobacterota bacterium]